MFFNVGEGGLDLSHDNTNVHFKKPRRSNCDILLDVCVLFCIGADDGILTETRSPMFLFRVLLLVITAILLSMFPCHG